MQCLADNNEVELIVFEKNLTLSSAIDGTNLKKLEREIGEVNTITAICYLINRFNSNFNFGKSLSIQQSALLASDLVEKYPYETIEDVVLMLKQVRQGIIGDGKDYKLDGQNVLTKWMPEYLDKKYEEVERQQKIIIQKSDDNNNAVSIFYAKRKAQKLAEEKIKLAELEIDNMVKIMDRQMLEDTILDWETKNDEELNKLLPYLRKKRKEVKGEYKP